MEMTNTEVSLNILSKIMVIFLYRKIVKNCKLFILMHYLTVNKKATSAPLLSNLHLCLWPGEIVVLFRNIPVVHPYNSFRIISWLFMGQIASVVVVPIQV